VERGGQLSAVGPSQAHHNLHPFQTRPLAGEPLWVVAERVAMSGHTLRWLVSRIDQSRPYYLLGEVEIADGRGPALAGRLDSVETYHPASYRGGILRLHYARAAELGPWLDLVAVRGEVVVQFWLQPGEAAVTLGVGEEKEVERIPEQLRRFLEGGQGISVEVESRNSDQNTLFLFCLLYVIMGWCIHKRHTASETVKQIQA